LVRGDIADAGRKRADGIQVLPREKPVGRKTMAPQDAQAIFSKVQAEFPMHRMQPAGCLQCRL
jgi:hypothetical protein